MVERPPSEGEKSCSQNSKKHTWQLKYQNDEFHSKLLLLLLFSARFSRAFAFAFSRAKKYSLSLSLASLFCLFLLYIILNNSHMGGKSTNTTLDDGKVQLTPSHLLDVIDEEWLEDSLPFDDVDVPANMRLSSSAYEMDYALLSGVSGAQGGASGSGGGISSSAGFSAGTGGGGGGGAQGDGNSGLAGGADDFIGGTDEGMRDEERWGRARV